MNCVIDPGTLTCTRCQNPASRADLRRNCYPGLGDIVAAGLAAVGITKEVVQSIAGENCGCEKRRQILNDLGRWIMVGVPPAGSTGPA